MFSVAFDGRRPDLRITIRASVSVGESLAIRREGVRSECASLIVRQRLRLSGAVGSDPVHAESFPVIGYNVLAVGSPHRKNTHAPQRCDTRRGAAIELAHPEV